MAPRSASEKVRPKKSYFSSACEYVKLPFYNVIKTASQYFRCSFFEKIPFHTCFGLSLDTFI
jgi:hypothetical protein